MFTKTRQKSFLYVSILFLIIISLMTNTFELSVGAFKKQLKADLSKCRLVTSPAFIEYFSSAAMAINGAKSWESSELSFTLHWNYSNDSYPYTARCVMTRNDNEDYIAVTYCFGNSVGSPVNQDQNDWNYAVIYANSRYRASRFSSATFAHEIGHAMGQSHVNCLPSSIMCQEAYGRTATVPSKYDRDSLSLKYRKRK